MGCGKINLWRWFNRTEPKCPGGSLVCSYIFIGCSSLFPLFPNGIRLYATEIKIMGKLITPKKYLESIHISRQESNFDRACEEANKSACLNYGLDENSHSKKIDFDRSTDTIVVKFIEYRCYMGYAGSPNYLYTFESWITRNTEE